MQNDPAPDDTRADVDETDAHWAQREPSTEVAIVGPPGESEWNTLERQAERLSESELVPSAFRRKPANLMLVFLTARELRIGPMQALAKIHVIDGKPTLSAEMMRALVLRAGHKFEFMGSTREACTVRVARRGGEWQVFEFTMEDAIAAELPERARGYGDRKKEKGTWDKFPKAMLLARATSDACRAVFPDVLAGASYTPEELGAVIDPMTGEVLADPDIETITVEQMHAFRARMNDLAKHDEKYRDSIVEQMREGGMILHRKTATGFVPMLPARRAVELDEILAGLEQYMPDEAPSHDDDVAQGEVVDTRAPGVDEAGGVQTPADERHDSPRSSAPPAPSSGPGTHEGPGPTEEPIEDAELVSEDGATLPLSSDTGEAEAAGAPGPGEVSTAPAAEAPPDKPRTETQRKKIMAASTEAGLDVVARHGVIRVVTRNRAESANDITKIEADRIYSVIKSIVAGDLAWDEYDFGGDIGKEHTVVIRTEKGQALLTAIGLMG